MIFKTLKKNNKMNIISKYTKFVIAIATIVCSSFTAANAQQVPLYSQYYFNPFLYNPAYAGSTDYAKIFVINRQQWTGMPGAPATQAVTIDGPIKAQKIGIGLSVYNDQISYFHRTGANFNYSYRMNFNEKHYLALGAGVGVLNNGIDYSQISVRDANDNLLGSQLANRTTFDASFGVRYHFKGIEAGIAVPQLLAPAVRYNSFNQVRNLNRFQFDRHYIGTLKYAFLFSEDRLKVEPMLFATAVRGAPIQFDGSVMTSWKNTYFVGLMYRNKYAFTTSVGVKIHERLIVSYAYDWVTTPTAQYLGGTHEITLGLQFGRSANDKKEAMLKDRLDNIEVMSKKTQDSLRKELNKTNAKVTEVENENDKIRGNMDQFKKDMIDSVDAANGLIPRSQNNGVVGELNKETNGNGQNGNRGNGQNSRKPGNVQGNNYYLDNIYFGNENAEVLPNSYPQLDALIDVLVKSPNMVIEIMGYADATGTYKFNKYISQQRANSVKRYLLQQGVKENQIRTVALSESKFLGDNKTLEGRKLNRRIELKVVKQ
ncbi:MAG: PorP/SprF family type IX secretion system membrane protein [Bacteroidota bacterium]|nr:PorP/SprF family type IX secretion system membrane protein [Bacteroidota bacterium]